MCAIIDRVLIGIIICVIAACFPSCAEIKDANRPLVFENGVTYQVMIGSDGKLYHVPLK